MMPRLRVELRTMIALVAALAFLIGGTKSYGWPENLLLSVTQFPYTWLLWWVVGCQRALKTSQQWALENQPF